MPAALNPETAPFTLAAAGEWSIGPDELADADEWMHPDELAGTRLEADEVWRRRGGGVRRPGGVVRPRPVRYQARPQARRRSTWPPRPRPPRGRVLPRYPRRGLPPAAPWPGEPLDPAPVHRLQHCLAQVLPMPVAITGYMTAATRAAVRIFQRRQGLRPSGRVDGPTHAALAAACAGRATWPVPVTYPEDAHTLPVIDQGAADDGVAPDDAAADEELGPLTATVRWLFKREGKGFNYLFSIAEAAQQPGSGIYLLLGTPRTGAQRRPMLLKVGLAETFRSRFGPAGYGRTSGTPAQLAHRDYDDLRAYLGLVALPPSPLPQLERALARTLYRAGETLPLDRKPPPEGPVQGSVRIKNIIPPGLDARLLAAYRAQTGPERRRAATGAARPITAGHPPQVPVGARTRQLVLEPGQFRNWELGGRDASPQHTEVTQMHTLDCTCPRCRTHGQWSAGPVAPFSAQEELALAMELLSVSSEAELDQFLGKLVKSAWRGLKKVGRFVGKVAKPFGRVLRGVAKAALPFVGKALGSFIPIPGVGTAIGGAVGSAIGKALEAEFADLAPAEQEFEMARAFVRLAGSAARDLAAAPSVADAPELLEAAVIDALRRRLPARLRSGAPRGAAGGRWVRQGGGIVVLGA